MRLFTTRKYRDFGILLVEDHQDIRESLPYLLEAVGFRKVWAVEDGTTALELIRSNQEVISVILLDIGLPDMTGLELFRCLMRSHNVPLAVIALTGHGMRDDKRSFFELGNDIVLAFKYRTKPVDLKSLRRALRTAFRTICELRERQSAGATSQGTEVPTE